MNPWQLIWGSTLGKKYVMAVTGVGMFVFVVGHLLGNLQVFGRPELINGYAHFLKSKPILLWGSRLGLLTILVFHVASAISLARLNRSARSEGYSGVAAPFGASLGSRTMLLSGLVVLAFVIYHLLHFTALRPGINGTGIDFSQLQTTLSDGTRTQDVYAMMVMGFRVWWVVLFYLVAQALLFMHLNHGLSSMFQSLGWRNHVWWPRVRTFAKVASILIFAGYFLIPMAIWLGLGKSYIDQVKAPQAGLLQDSGKEGI
jgi:succinate dehydrogenase / fumarate reductase cytochrome b subunit